MLLVLDRDGVINFESPAYIKSPEEWLPIPGSIAAIGQLSHAKHKIVIATNQAGVGRGYYTLETLDAIHQKMLSMIAAAGGTIEHVYFCPHHPDEKCACRKPKPGMLLQIQRDFQISGKEMLFIGDSMRDYEASKAANCAFILVRTGFGRETEKTLKDPAVKVFDDLEKVANHLCV